MQFSINDNYQEVEIFIQCRNLKDTDVFSKSDPQVIFKQKRNAEEWKEIGRTETIKNELNPNFQRSFLLEYYFEEKQELHFQVIDDDNGSYDHLGECYTTLGAIVGAKNNTLVLDLIDNKDQNRVYKSKIALIADKISDCNSYIQGQWQGVKLMNTDGWFDKSDPFLRFKKIRDDQTQVQVHETEVIMDNLNPIWKPFEISCERLNSGNMQQNIKVECWDWEKSLKFQYIGEFTFTVEELNNGKREFELINLKKKHPGKIVLSQYKFFQKPKIPTFLEYIRGNIQLNLVLAVDFTEQNGPIEKPTSLHHCNPQGMNAYQQAIQSVGEILLDYDFDKKVYCYGFGGKLRFPDLTSTYVNHCFPMSGNQINVQASGLQEIQNLYLHSLKHVKLSNPTRFNPILKETIKLAQHSKEYGSQVYNILLILTQGLIEDMKETIETIVKSSNLPLSVIVVGIGNADFSGMEMLDGDKNRLVSSEGKKAARDIVQFVPFRDFKGNGPELSKQVLAEIPRQLVEYMTSEGIKPKNASQIEREQFIMSHSNSLHVVHKPPSKPVSPMTTSYTRQLPV